MNGFAAFMLAASLATVPAPPIDVNAWAEAYRVVTAESGSPRPGPWRGDFLEHLREVQEVLSVDHPARTVAIAKSAQTGFSEAVLNALGHCIHTRPRSILVLLPTQAEVQKYDRLKLGQMIDSCRELRALVTAPKSRDGKAETTAFKPFPGGFLILTTASSSAGLQMASCGYRVYEEITGYPEDVAGRGDPMAQANSRSIAWKDRGDKEVKLSTPGLKGQCRITSAFEAGDQRRYYLQCPHCQHWQQVLWSSMKWRAEKRPYGAHLVCLANGCVIEGKERRAFQKGGHWIKCWKSPTESSPPLHFADTQLAHWRDRGSDNRDPSFHFWQGVSPLVPWDEIVHEWLGAQGRPDLLRAFWQQWLGEPWETQGEAPDLDRLLERRQKWPAGRLPAGVLLVTGAVDVQADRLEWAIYGWGRDMAQYLVATGICPGDPNSAAVWLALDDVRAKTWADAWSKPQPVDAWGIDAGYLSQAVYRYVRARAGSQKLFALDGRPGWRLPAIGTPKNIDVDYDGHKVGTVQLWPVGTWDLKSELYWSLRQTIDGPNETGTWKAGAFWLNELADRRYLEQLTAEYLADVRGRHGGMVKEWVRRKHMSNEQHDLAIYCRALARHECIGATEETWNLREKQRLGPAKSAQGDLADLWRGGLVEAPPRPPPAPAPVPFRRTLSTGLEV